MFSFSLFHPHFLPPFLSPLTLFFYVFSLSYSSCLFLKSPLSSSTYTHSLNMSGKLKRLKMKIYNFHLIKEALNKYFICPITIITCYWLCTCTVHLQKHSLLLMLIFKYRVIWANKQSYGTTNCILKADQKSWEFETEYVQTGSQSPLSPAGRCRWFSVKLDLLSKHHTDLEISISWCYVRSARRFEAEVSRRSWGCTVVV